MHQRDGIWHAISSIGRNDYSVQSGQVNSLVKFIIQYLTLVQYLIQEPQVKLASDE